jgi:hypothetical protein
MELIKLISLNLTVVAGAFYLLHLAVKSAKQKSKHRHN